MVERFNRTLLDMLATTAHNHPSDLYIRKVCLAYNSSSHSTIGFSPFFLMFGHEVKLPVDLMYGSNPQEQTTAIEYVQKLKDGLRDAYSQVHELCEAEHKRQKSLYDEKVHGKSFSVGDLVWLYTPAALRGKCRKLNHPWKGPFQILQRVSDSTYKI